mgnify:CR=1 FL=1
MKKRWKIFTYSLLATRLVRDCSNKVRFLLLVSCFLLLALGEFKVNSTINSIDFSQRVLYNQNRKWSVVSGQYNGKG